VTLITSRTSPRSSLWLYYKHKPAVQNKSVNIVVLNEQCVLPPRHA
jgi:hypothetical protein